MINRYSTIGIYKVVILILLCCSANLRAQQEMTREERIKTLQLLKESDAQLEQSTLRQSAENMPYDINTLQLPPLSVFMDAVVENSTVRRAQSQVEQVKNQYRIEKRNWWNYIRLNGNYGYGRYNVLNENADTFVD